MAGEHNKTEAAQLRTLILCLLCTFGLVAGWTPEPQGGALYESVPPGWIGGVIPYMLDENLPDWGRESAEAAMAAWTEATVLKFVPRTDEPDFIYFTERTDNCVRQPTCRPVYSFVPNMVHGVGHGLLLSHEQQRRDRDRYVRVFQEHISPHERGQWNPGALHGAGADISPYNYQSVMHYGFLSSKRNRRGGPPALETIPPHMPVGETSYTGPDGQTTYITPGDADTVARMFGLTPTSWTVSTNPLGLTVLVDGEEATTPAVFDWTPGSEHTLSVPSLQVRPGSRYRFGRWSDDGAATHTVIATSDTTLYEANFVAAHRISTRVRPEGAGTVTISPGSSDGYYPLRSEVTMSAEPTAGSGFRFLRWEISSDYLWQFVVTHETHGYSANPAHSYAMPGLEYTAVFTQGPVLRVESNANPTTVEINGDEYRTPVALEARSLPERVTVAVGKDYLEHEKGYRDRFHSWSDGGDEAHAVTVSRTEDTILELTVDTDYRLATRPPANGDGEIVVTPSSEDGFYPEGTEVRLLATAVPPRKFIGWNGDVSGAEPAASVVMDTGKLVQAVVGRPRTELRHGVPVEVSLRWNGNEVDFKQHYVRVPDDASELEIEFRTQAVTPGTEAGLFVATHGEVWPDQVRHENADSVLRSGVETITIPRPPDGWPAAYFILIRAAEADGDGTQTLEGTLVARVSEEGSSNRVPGQVLENPQPGSYQSGVGVIFGWVCEAERIEIEIQHGTTGVVSTLAAGYGTNRADTMDVCDNDGDNGFSLAVNWNLLGAGRHTVRALADGEEFARRQVIVGTLGAGEFPTGLEGTFVLPDFPAAGQETSVRWEESLQNFVILGTE